MIDQFIEAAKEGLTEDIEQLLKQDPELLQGMRENGETPLIVALYHGKQAVVQQLISYGVAISAHEAAAIGELETLQFLLNEKPSLISECSYDGWTPLHLSAFFGSYETAEFLIQQGANVNAISTNNNQNYPLHAAAAGRKYPLVKLLLEHGANVNAQQMGGWTALHQAVENYDIEMVNLLLAFGADREIVQDNGETPIHIAEKKEYEEIEKKLKASKED